MLLLLIGGFTAFYFSAMATFTIPVDQEDGLDSGGRQGLGRPLSIAWAQVVRHRSKDPWKNR